MTNSITTAKCPSLLSSGNYGMSQNRCTDDSKEYIFVKLTDSAYRAVEEYQRNESAKRFANGQCARIQFIGNSGVIHFPTPSDSGNNGEGRGREFGFAIDDVDGSLECIQQTQHDLDVLGSLSYRMRIQANDDIYDTTRTKMAIAEETEKSKCIREIKPNQTDIGRKVKKFPTLSSASASNSNNSASPSSFHNSNINNHHTSHSHVGHINGNNSINNSNNNNNNSSNSSSSYLLSHSNRNKLTATLSSNSPPMNGLGGGSSKLGASNATSSSRSPNPTTLGGSGTIANSRYGSHTTSSTSSSAVASTNLYSQNNAPLPSLSASSLSSTLAGGIANGYASAANNSPPDSTAGVVGKVNKVGGGGGGGGGSMNFTASGNANIRGNGNSNGGAKGSLIGGSAGGGNKQSSTSSGSSGSKLPDISRRKIRERLIHLLALKPFKKPELYSRLQNEGLRERERSLISNILRDISSLSRDNTYNLKRLIWNDVNENWPYYTEQELQQLKRRKPQNLTPPNCSDAGSSTSGQSPTSTHTGSPPPMVGSGVGGSGSLKRTSLESDRYDDTMLSGVLAKKQRISHFKKDANPTNGGGPNRIGGGVGFGSSGSSNYAQQNNRLTSYSPHSSHSSQTAADENSVNTDLSYSVLDNDLMPHIERNSGSNYYSAGSISRKTNGNNTNTNTNNVNSKSAGLASNSKEKRNSAGSNSSAGSGTYVASQERSNKDLMRKSATSSVSPTPYGANFVPESKTGGSSSSNSVNINSNNRSSGTSSSNNISSSYQRHSPSFAQQQQQQQQHKSSSSNSSINSPKAPVAQMSPQEELISGNNSNSSSSSTHRNNANISSSSGRYQQNAARSASKIVRSPSSPQQQQQTQQQQQQQRHHQQQQSSHYYKQPSPTNSQYHHPQQQPQLQAQMQPLQPQSLQQQQPSPTQQMAAAASSYALIPNPLNKPRYDFTKYTPITTIEERRKYKTEFENDYGEYLRLLEQIEGVGNRFRNLAARLENVSPGGTEHNNIKQLIFHEYERIRNEEALNRKQRFDYLHEKLAYIKQLVSDYDKTLTQTNNAAEHQQLQQQQQSQLQLQPQQHSVTQNQQTQEYASSIEQSSASEAVNSAVTAAAGGIVGDAANMLSATAHNSRLSPMVASGDSNSPPTAQRNYHSRQLQQQQLQQRQNYQQHHDAETIQRLPKNSPTTQSDTSNAVTSQHHHPQQQQQLHYNGHHVPHDNNNNNSHNNDTDSEESSDSNDDDDDDDDDDSNSNSNDDDDDNERY